MAEKRKSDDDPLKVSKFKASNEGDEVSSAAKLMNLNDNLLTIICDLLSLDDLTNFARVNERFNNFALKFLGQKSANATASIVCSREGDWFSVLGTFGKFTFSNPSELSKFFQLSGELILSLQVDCKPNVSVSSYQIVEQAISDHCSATLTELEIHSFYLPVMVEVQTPFESVQTLELDACELSENLGQQFNELFPSLTKLVLKDCAAHDVRCIEVNFPGLEELIVFETCKNQAVFKKDNILKALELNPQIRHLIVDFNKRLTNEKDFQLDFAFYRRVAEYLPELETLKMSAHRKFQAKCGKFYVPHAKNIEFQSLESFALSWICDQQPIDVAPFTFQYLRELKLENLTRLSNEWIEFIIQNEGLSKLSIDFYAMRRNSEGDEIQQKIKRNQLQTIFKALTQIEEIHLHAGSVLPKDICAMLWIRKTLKFVYLREYFMVDSIVETFDKLTAKRPWDIDYDWENLIIKRTIWPQ